MPAGYVIGVSPAVQLRTWRRVVGQVGWRRAAQEVLMQAHTRIMLLGTRDGDQWVR